MPAIFAFKCSCCGKVHEGSPSIAFDAPWHYAGLLDREKGSIAKLSSDFCQITNGDGADDYFIRTILEIPIDGVTEPFTWGVWVSLSAQSFARYRETYDSPAAGEGFFGWLCNRLPGYPDTIALPTDVAVQLGGARPILRLHQSHGAAENQLAIDQREGISVARAQEIAEQALHAN